MKNMLAVVLYASFLLLALRAQAAGDDIDSKLAEVDAALAAHRASGRVEAREQAAAMLRELRARAPDDYRVQRTEVALLLARHDPRAALTRAQMLNGRFPDDVDTYGLLIDAELALGRHADAERDTQRLLDLRPDNVPGLMRAARLRELVGDWQGAIDFVNACLNRVSDDQREQRAALYTQLARLHFGAGDGAVAEQARNAALTAWPDYAPALAEGVRMARLRGDTGQALHLAEVLYRVLPGANELLMLARARAAAGEGAMAAPLFREFTRRAHAVADTDDNVNLALSSYYAFEGHDAERAVSFAASVRAQTADVETLLALATALHRAGRDDEARAPITTLTRLGWRDAEFVALATALRVSVASAATIELH